MYAAINTEPFPVPAVDVSTIDPRYFRQIVDLPERIPNVPGALIVDPGRFFLYLVRASGEAFRYGVGVGREGFAWNGTAKIKAKREWPWWYPPREMVERDPRAAPWSEGMPGGLDNPLGARALYLYEGERDTLYRIHGTNEPWTIGTAASSGCIRMFNQDIIDLAGRVPLGTDVIVLPATSHEQPVSMLHEH
jgi:lipoprotein-anchoring transpeptidase ErfK/SrfK